MIRSLLISIALLALSVPWWFSGSEGGAVALGMPGWALFAVAASFAYACAISWLLRAQWRGHGGDEPDDDEA